MSTKFPIVPGARVVSARVVSACTLLLALVGCASSATSGGDDRWTGPRLVVLGTAQDGGVPHASCGCERCENARDDGAARRMVASLGIVSPDDSAVHVIDATPDLPAQLERLRAHSLNASARAGVERAPFGGPGQGGILLTHAHMGHYLGLAHLGFEVVHTRGVPVYATERMRRFLTSNSPWDQLVDFGEIELVTLVVDVSVELRAGVHVTAFSVPHRDELSDTVGFRIDGPRRSFLYVPDTDDWELWSPSLVQRLEGIDVALLDGSFYSLDELPGRSLDEVRHPLIHETIALLEKHVETTDLEVYFTHLNHTNRALGPGRTAADEIEARGFFVLEDGQVFEL